MTKFEHYLSGQVFGIKYIFENVHDGLPAHVHEADSAHNVCVLRGEVLVVFDRSTHHLRSGDIYDFDGTQRHWILAIQPDSVIFNAFLNGQPEAYKMLPPEELKGEFDVRKFNRGVYP